MTDEKRPEFRNGFICDDGYVCMQCIVQPDENPWALPWLFVGERFRCSRCKGDYRQPEE